MRHFFTALLSACQKANNIAVACRTEPELLALLSQEKKGEEKNSKFDQDFKTLADVLIQETVRFELSKLSPILSDRIFGEESNTFTNSLGQSIALKLTDCCEDTRITLEKVLDGNKKVSLLLAEEVHRAVKLTNEITENIREFPDAELDLSGVGVWIDPIDGTSHYIQGKEVLEDGYPVKGLQVAKVLIGVYDLKSGRPLIGVVGSPFSESGSLVFGSCVSPASAVFPPLPPLQPPSGLPRVVVGFSDNEPSFSKLYGHFKIMRAGGAGHKMMMVLEDVAQLYICSSSTVFTWDTCGPHALLEASGGGLRTYKGFKDVVYNDATGGVCHRDGIVVFRDIKYLQLLQDCFK